MEGDGQACWARSYVSSLRVHFFLRLDSSYIALLPFSANIKFQVLDCDAHTYKLPSREVALWVMDSQILSYS